MDSKPIEKINPLAYNYNRYTVANKLNEVTVRINELSQVVEQLKYFTELRSDDFK